MITKTTRTLQSEVEVAATILDGTQIALEVRQEVTEAVNRLKLEQQITPGLAVVLVGENPASASYVRGKERACGEVGIYTETFHLPDDTPQSQVLELINRLNDDKRFHGILTQLPFPPQIDEQIVIDIGVRYLLIVGGFYIVFSIMFSFNAIFRGAFVIRRKINLSGRSCYPTIVSKAFT